MSLFAALRKPVTVTRYAAGAYVDGFWQEGGTSPVTITASVQPASQTDMQLLPEGRRLTGAYRLFTDDTMLLASGAQQADRVTIGGAEYEVMAEAVWENGLIPHKSYLVARIVEGT
ncbi:MAG: hypothetical protein KJP02_11895 [Octadecabacter sp.]|nr:hypothetical protein [Octadecabacter sp.]